MAIFYPGAAKHQLLGKSTTPLAARIINVHTMVWDLESCENYFAQSGNPYSHFGTGPKGEVYQWQDLTYRAASDLDGNTFVISIENADKGPGFPSWSGTDVPRFVPEQAELIAQLIAWCCARFGIPPYEVPNSLPGVVGPGKHRDGIDPWRVSGGVLYSSSYGKACPGDRRVAQFHNEIMPRVRELLSPNPVPPPEDEDDMFVLYNPNNTFWLVTAAGSIQISDDCYGRLINSGLKAVAPAEPDAAAIINGTGRILAGVQAGNDQRGEIVDVLTPGSPTPP